MIVAFPGHIHLLFKVIGISESLRLIETNCKMIMYRMTEPVNIQNKHKQVRK